MNKLNLCSISRDHTQRPLSSTRRQQSPLMELPVVGKGWDHICQLSCLCNMQTPRCCQLELQEQLLWGAPGVKPWYPCWHTSQLQQTHHRSQLSCSGKMVAPLGRQHKKGQNQQTVREGGNKKLIRNSRGNTKSRKGLGKGGAAWWTGYFSLAHGQSTLDWVYSKRPQPEWRVHAGARKSVRRKEQQSGAVMDWSQPPIPYLPVLAVEKLRGKTENESGRQGKELF